MSKLIITLSVLISFISVHGQDLVIPDNPYDNAPPHAAVKNSFKRERWFYEQRMFPNNFIPEDAYIKAYEQKMELRRQNGFASMSTPWTCIGPTPGYYFSWSNISGRTVTVKYNPVNPAIIYIGGAFGGVWRSDNGGFNWEQKTDFEPSMSSGSIAIDPNNPNTIYYGTGEATFSIVSYYGRGIMKSTNGGTNWTNYTSGLPLLTYCSRIIVKPTDSNFLLAAMSNSGLYRSTDAGQNWTLAVGQRCDDVVFSQNGQNAYIVGNGTGYQVSTDGGMTFTSNSSILMGSRNHIAICRTVPSVLYFTRYSGTVVQVYKSTNGGINYTQCAPSYSFAGTGQAWYDYYIQVNPFDPNYAYVGLIDIFRTTDGGTTFEIYAGGDVHVDQHNMDFNPVNPDELIAVNDGGVWKSTDRGTTFINLNANLTMTQFYRMTSDPSNPNHLAGGTQDNGTQRTTGTINWAAGFGGDGGEVCFHPVNPQFILGETQNNGVYRSQNGGISWAPAQNGLSGNGAWVAPIIAHPTESGVFYTARQLVFKTSDNGASWQSISSMPLGTVREMAISRSNPNIMYATASSQVLKSTDGGTNFTNVTSGLPGRVITGVYIHPDSSDVAVLSISGFGGGKVFKTTNGGTNWLNISGNLPDSPCNDVLIYYPGYPTDMYYCAMDIGVFVTDDWGETWTELADGLPNTVAMNLDYNLMANKLRIGTHGRGVWEITTPTGIVNYSGEIPEHYSLHQNYPNPFNPSTSIKFSLVKAARVKLVVYDMLGRQVEELINDMKAPGTYTVQFDGGKLSSGVYFYKLSAINETDNFNETKKMLLNK